MEQSMLLPDGPRKSEARAIMDGTIGTANAKNMILGSEYAKPDTPASASLASNKWLVFAGVAVALIVMFLVGYLVLQKKEKATTTPAETAAPAAVTASEAASEASAPAAIAQPQKKADPNVRSQLKSGDVSITETKNGERVIRSGDLVIRMPD